MRGKITEFTKENGFGRIELEDGQDLHFDGSTLSRFDVRPGDEGEVELKEIRGRTIVIRIDVE